MILQTARLILRSLGLEDADFILQLLNDPTFVEYIGDRGVRTFEDAWSYLREGPIASYQRNGYGLWCVALASSRLPIGICGLVKRDTLNDADIGYALLPEFCSRGYALESVSAVLAYSRETLCLNRVLAVVDSENARSLKLLDKLGFRYERMIRLSDESKEVKLLASIAQEISHARQNEGSRHAGGQ